MVVDSPEPIGTFEDSEQRDMDMARELFECHIDKYQGRY